MLVISRAAPGQAATPPAGAAPIRTLLGDLALVFRNQGDGTLAIGVAGATRSVLLRVRVSDARRWADTVTRLLAAPPPPGRRRGPGATARPGGDDAGTARPAGGRRGVRRPPSPAAPNDTPAVARARALLEEPGVGAGTMGLTRLDSAGTRRWLLFVDDAELSPLRATLDREEATTLARLVRRAATPPAPRPAAKPRRGAPPAGATASRPPRRP